MAALTGCTGDEPSEPDGADSTPSGTTAPASAAPEVPALEPAWTADLGGETSARRVDAGAARTGEVTVWTAGANLVVAGQERVTAVDAATGAVAWTWEVPSDLGSLCMAGDPAQTGVVGLVAGRGTGCGTVVGFDLGSGRELWRAGLGDDVDTNVEDRAPYSAPGRLVVPTFCGATEVFGLRDGAPLPDLTTPESADSCDVRTRIRDGVAVTLDEGAGEVPDVLTAIDLRRDRELFSTPSRGITRLQGVRSADPLVLDVIEGDGSLNVMVDDRGRPQHHVGLQTWSNTSSTESLGVVDDTLVLTYESSAPGPPHFYGFDVASGEAAWATRSGREYVVGRHGDSLVLLGGDVDAYAESAVLGEAPAGDVQAATALGTFAYPGGARLGWTDDLFLVRDGGTLTAYRFPEGSDQPLPAITNAVPESAPGDVAVDADHGLCGAIGTDVLVALGVPDRGLPAPSACEWYVRSYSAVDVHPRVWADGEQASADGMDLALEGLDGSAAEAAPLPGLGDEAVVVTTREEDTGEVLLVARRANLVVGLRATNHLFAAPPTEADVAAMQTAAVTAMEQVLAAAPLAQEG